MKCKTQMRQSVNKAKKLILQNTLPFKSLGLERCLNVFEKKKSLFLKKAAFI